MPPTMEVAPDKIRNGFNDDLVSPGRVTHEWGRCRRTSAHHAGARPDDPDGHHEIHRWPCDRLFDTSTSTNRALATPVFVMRPTACAKCAVSTARKRSIGGRSFSSPLTRSPQPRRDTATVDANRGVTLCR